MCDRGGGKRRLDSVNKEPREGTVKTWTKRGSKPVPMTFQSFETRSRDIENKLYSGR